MERIWGEGEEGLDNRQGPSAKAAAPLETKARPGKDDDYAQAGVFHLPAASCTIAVQESWQLQLDPGYPSPVPGESIQIMQGTRNPCEREAVQKPRPTSPDLHECVWIHLIARSMATHCYSMSGTSIFVTQIS
jgi:hypothetical protein